MSRDDTLLELELRLLIAQHGKTRVSKALSAIGEVDLSVIDNGIRAFEDRAKRKNGQRSSKKSIEELVHEAKPNSLDAKRLIEKLAHAYENKEFLPELRKVKHFLESRSIPVTRIRSRADALPRVLRVLAQAELDDLQVLNERTRVRESDLGMITDQILGRKDKPGNPD